PTPTPTPAPTAPTFAKAFSPTSVAAGPTAKTTLTYTITNTAALPLTGLSFSDPLPAGLIVATPNNLNNGCGGTVAAPPGANSILLVNGSLAANASCTISLDLQVTATTAGSLTSPAVVLSSNQAPNATAAAINLAVTVPAPTFTMAFSPNPLGPLGPAPVTGTGTLTFTITNNAAIPLTGVSFSHTLPGAPSLTVGPGVPPPLPATCGAGANLAANVGGNTIQFTGGSVAVGGTCTVTIPVQTAPLPAPGTYSYPNSPVTLNSTQAAPVQAGPVTWTVVVN
ncbi:hypothetical protein, partial [Synechococcus sp. H55.8]|uniref:DUF7933 domain-containing protein n=3 Tax=unclassified Synechococcus TaxID=2626047 RepID=UPI0039C1CE1C